ncbi:MAG: hypothetical protein ACYCW6_27890 [Candidatus Xenobia bacterium]
MRTALFGLFLCLTVTALMAAPDTRGRQLIDHLYVVNGGLPVQDMTVKADVFGVPKGQPNGNLVPISNDTIFFKQPNKLRINSLTISPGDAMDGKLLTIIRDGSNAFMFISLGAYPIKKQPDEQSGTLNLPCLLQRYPADANKDYVLAGHQTISGVQTTVVRIDNPATPQNVMTVWIDTKRWVPMQCEVHEPGKKPGDPETIKRVVYRDIGAYKDGRYFPHKLEIYVNNVLDHVLVYKALSVNTGLADNLFEPMKPLMP